MKVQNLNIVALWLFGMMTIYTSTNAQTLTAHEATVKTDPVAQSWAADAELIFVGTAVEPGMYADGTADGWACGYYSTLKDSARNYYATKLGPVSFESEPKEGCPSLVSIGDNWKDSDRAAWSAENHRGRLFRVEHPDAIVAASLSSNVRSSSGKLLSGIWWDITYWSAADTAILKIQIHATSLSPPAQWNPVLPSPSVDQDAVMMNSNQDTLAVIHLTEGHLDSLELSVYPGYFPPDSEGKKAVARYFELTPFPADASFNTTLTLYYNQNDFDLSGIEDEAALALFRLTDQGWECMGGTADPERNGVTVTNVTEFSSWAFADPNDHPLLVESDIAPSRFELSQNYPNPFNPETTIRFSIPKAGRVIMKLFDPLGRKIRTLADRIYPAGSHQVTLDASELASGIYVYALEYDGFKTIRKMAVLK